MRPSRCVFGAYLLVLSLLLAVPDPWALFGIHNPPRLGAVRGVHFAFFAVLAVLAFGSRFPWRPWLLVAMLVVYGAATELFQTLVPPRTIDLVDFAENVLGIALGSLAWCALCAAKRQLVDRGAVSAPVEPSAVEPT